MKLAKRTLSNGITSAYILSRDKGEYSIICIEENLNNDTTKIHQCKQVTPVKKTALGFFRKIVLGKVFGISLLDVLYNLLE